MNAIGLLAIVSASCAWTVSFLAASDRRFGVSTVGLLLGCVGLGLALAVVADGTERTVEAARASGDLVAPAP
jgi:hypothetical protein